MKKAIKILLVMMILITAFTITVNAAQGATSGKDPSGYTGKGAEVGQIETLGNKIIQIVSVIGSIASVIVLIVLGLLFALYSRKSKQ